MRFVIGIVLCISISTIASATEKIYSLGAGRGAIVLNVPDDWDDPSFAPQAGWDTPAHIQFSVNETDCRFSMTLEPFPPERKGGPATTHPNLLKTLTRRMYEWHTSPVAAKTADLQPIEGNAAHGYWFDETENLSEFGVVQSGGAVAVGDVILKVEVMHQKESPATKLAREMLATARIDKDPKPATQPAQRAAPTTKPVRGRAAAG